MSKLIYTILAVSIATLVIGVSLQGCNLEKSDTQDFTVETLAMAIGYELRNGFDWNASVDNYYNAIMEGKMSIDAAKAAEGYLRERTHPLIANRLVRLAGMVGFKMDDLGGIVGVEAVNIHLLQVAAQGFKQGLLLDRPSP
jgi:hypothetical protein